MNFTANMYEDDDPRAQVIEDSNGIPFLVIGSPGSFGGLTVELTTDLLTDLQKIVKDIEEDADAASRADDGTVLTGRNGRTVGGSHDHRGNRTAG